VRFVCGLIMHLFVTENFKQGQNMMKFAVNHPYKFRNWSLAFMTGALQFFVALSCEVLCYFSLI